MIIKKFAHITISTIVLFVFCLSSCTYNNEEELYPEVPVIDSLSYTEDVLPIIEVNCYACHQNGSTSGGVNLEGYENLTIHVESGSLLGTIRHDEGWSAMPKGASKLSDSQIEKVSKWIDEGYPNN